MNRTARVLSNVVYGIGAAIALALGLIACFGSNEPVFPEAMLPYSQKELAFLWLSLGAIPMMAACFAVYKFNALGNGPHKVRNCILVFLPGFVCCACALFIVGVVMVGMIRTAMSGL